MCQRVKSDGSARPGTWQILSTKKGTQISMYGMGNGSQYNARWESILTTWRELNQNRAIMKVDAFWEGEGCFKRKDGKNFNLGCILNGRNEFAILTVEPNEVVKPYHRRAPLCLSDDSVTFFLEGCVKEIKQLDSGLYIVSNKIAA